MNGKIVAGASIGAVLGAGLWIAVAVMMQAEWGVAAWFVGGLVGWGARMAGAADPKSAILCAVLAALAILGGKAGALAIALPYEVKSELEQTMPGFGRAQYSEMQTDARDFLSVDRSDYHAVTTYMVEHGFTDAESAADVGEAEFNAFWENWVADLEAFERDQPSYEEWKAARLDKAYQAIMTTVPKSELVMSMFSLFDLLWFFLGVGTAFRIGAGMVSEDVG